MNLERALNTPGWMSPEELQYLATAASTSQRIVEIGSWRGRSSKAIADNMAGELWCVDTWNNGACGIAGWWTEEDTRRKLHQQTDWLWWEWYNGIGEPLIHQRVHPIWMDSLKGAEQCRAQGLTFDMVFIDAGHSYEEVAADIKAWRQMCRGILCGHDYCSAHTEVIKAVDELVGAVRVIDSIWTTQL